jgi:hypothetical protein
LVARAGTLLIPSGPTGNANLRHLHIVCTEPCSKGQQLLVSVTTWTNSLCDDACILDVGDHPFIRHKSWVMYRKARLELADDLDNGVAIGVLVPHQPVADAVFERIVAGICASRSSPYKIKQYFGC